MTAIELGNVVKSYKLGNSSIQVCDDYCRSMSMADIEVILRRMAFKAQEQLSAHAVSYHLLTDNYLYGSHKAP